MKAEIQKQTKKQPLKYSTYLEFIVWTALPYPEKVKLGMETQNQFAEYHLVDIATLSLWKKRPDFEKRVDAVLKSWSVDKTPDIIHSIYRSAVKGNALSQSLWLGYFKGYNPKKGDGEKIEKVEISENDFRFIVNGLPEPMRTKYHGYLTEIIDSAYAIANARDSEDDVWSARKPDIENEIPDESNTDAHNISDTRRTNDVAKSYKKSTRADMEWRESQNYYQSTARGWEE